MLPQITTCLRCQRSLLPISFARDASKANGQKSHCKDCDNAKSARYYQANRERVLVRIKANPRYQSRIGPTCKKCDKPRVSSRHWYCEEHALEARKKHNHRANRSPEKRLWDKLRYNRVHKALRKQWARIVAQGGVRCARGPECLFGDGKHGGLIYPDEPWDLGHDADGQIHGPEHRRCNRATAKWTKPESPRSREW